ncbi:MAG TPA: polyprenyl diphosphate synthase [Polyangiales bacterium]|nr:polyprenyl diphosphate synthase [Polyangiales bacterium]
MTSETTKRQFALELWKSQGGPLTLLWRTIAELVQRPFYPVYERALTAAAESWRKPQHIGIIMDGNRRFAKQLGASNVAIGHAVGADKLREMLDWCFEQNIPVVTVWGFSLENFHRNAEEVESLFELFERKTLEMVTSPDLHDNEVRVRFIGRRDLLPESLQDAIRQVERATGHYQRFVLNIALAYGGREEIADAFLEYLSHAKSTGKSLEQVIDEFAPQVVDRYLYTSGLPEPDLIIRTSGEVRLSGFMLWQSANSEYYFCDTNWPAFRKIDFLRALRSFDLRQRRFGR